MNPKLIPIAVIVAGLLLGAAAAVIVETWVIPSTGTIAIAAYLAPFTEDDVYVNGSGVDWGTVAPGTVTPIGFTVQNISPQPVTIYITHEAIPSYLNLTWAYNATVFAPNESKASTLNLGVNASAPLGPFDFTTWLIAEP